MGQIVLSQRNLPFGVPAMASLTGRGIAVLCVELAQIWSHPSSWGPARSLQLKNHRWGNGLLLMGVQKGKKCFAKGE